jgi:hypothetical protein
LAARHARLGQGACGLRAQDGERGQFGFDRNLEIVHDSELGDPGRCLRTLAPRNEQAHALFAHAGDQAGKDVATHVEQEGPTALPRRLPDDRARCDPMQKADPVLARGTKDIVALAIEQNRRSLCSR